jgi:hypothetical protein
MPGPLGAWQRWHWSRLAKLWLPQPGHLRTHHRRRVPAHVPSDSHCPSMLNMSTPTIDVAPHTLSSRPSH